MNVFRINGISTSNQKKTPYNQNFGRLVFTSPEAKAKFLAEVYKIDKPAFKKQLLNLIETHAQIPELVLTDGEELVKVRGGTFVFSKQFVPSLYMVLRDMFTNARKHSKKICLEITRKPIKEIIEGCKIATLEQFQAYSSKLEAKRAEIRRIHHRVRPGTVITADEPMSIAV